MQQGKRIQEKKLTGNIQGLFNKRIIRDLGRNQITSGNEKAKGNNRGMRHLLREYKLGKFGTLEKQDRDKRFNV
jgi:hypothetical protein